MNGPNPEYLNQLSVLSFFVLGCILNKSNSMQLGNFIDIFLARRVSGTYAHHQEH